MPGDRMPPDLDPRRASVDPRPAGGGEELAAETDAERGQARGQGFAEEPNLIRQERVAVGFVGAHGAAHHDQSTVAGQGGRKRSGHHARFDGVARAGDRRLEGPQRLGRTVEDSEDSRHSVL